MRHLVAAIGCLTLLGCANFERPVFPRSGGTGPIVDSENLRVVMHQPVTVDPLLPEPGDIWADVMPSRRAAIVPSRQVKQPPRQVVVATSASPARVAPPPSAVLALAANPAKPASVTPPPDAPQRQFSVQLTAANSETAALAQWQRLQKEMPQLIGGRVPAVIMAEIAGKSLWRLRTGGFESRADANSFCTRIQAEHAACWVVASAS